MMNEIIQDLINTGEVVSFTNNVIVETKKEEEHNKIVKEMIKRLVKNDLKSYTQASKINVEDVICIKDTFPTTSPKKITEINNIINKSSLVKSKIKMTMKKPLRKQVIVFISKINANIIRSSANFHINFINRHLKKTNLNTLANFIYMEKFGIIVITNQVTSVQDIGIIKKVLKEFENINQDLIKSSHLLQSKLYLKILDLPYYLENTNNSITSELVKEVIKKFHIFNNITPTSKL